VNAHGRSRAGRKRTSLSDLKKVFTTWLGVPGGAQRRSNLLEQVSPKRLACTFGRGPPAKIRLK